MTYIRNKKRDQIEMAQAVIKAETHYVRRKLTVGLYAWIKWMQIKRKQETRELNCILYDRELKLIHFSVYRCIFVKSFLCS